MGINDYGTPTDPLNAPPLSDWAEAVATVVDGSDVSVDTRLAAYMLAEYGEHEVRWNGTGWRYRGATITVRPTNVPAWPDGSVVWNTSQNVEVTTPPALGIDGDMWIPHRDAVVNA